MIRHNLTLAWRRMIGQPLFSGITILGLGLGLAAFLLIWQYVSFERGFNASFARGERIFRVVIRLPEEGFTPFLPPAFGPAVEANIAGVEESLRLGPNLGDGVFAVATGEQGDDQQVFREANIAYVDGNFLDLFDRPIQDGSADLSAPFTLALNASTARRYFGTTRAAGRQIVVNNQFGEANYTVAGVFADMPENTDFRPDILLALQTLATPEGRGGADWADLSSMDNAFVQTFLRLDDGSQAGTVAESVQRLVAQRYGEEAPDVHLQALPDMHLGQSLADPLPTFGSLAAVWFLAVLALIILLIAWINYVNLSTAKALQRVREFSLRKVVGATRGQLIRQHLWETGGYALLALLVGVLVVELVEGAYGQVLGLEVDAMRRGGAGRWWTALTALAVLVLGAGVYVAMVVTRFRPEQALRGAFSGTPTGGRLRRLLVLVQFAVSVALIAGTFLLYKQLQYLEARDLGAQLEQRLAIQGPEVRGEASSEAFLDRLDQLPWVDAYSVSGGIPGHGYNFAANRITRPNPAPGAEDISFNMLMIDSRYLATYAIDLVAGQGYDSRDTRQGWGSKEVLINETAARRLGFDTPASAAGQLIQWGENPLRVLGVVEDYNHESLHAPVGPTLYFPGLNDRYFTLVMTPEDLPRRLRALEALYAEWYPGNPFQYFFVDESFQMAYQRERRTATIFSVAALLALFISCMGLFGLAVYAAEQRTKEIGIRKVLGASVGQLVARLTGDFLKPVFLAMLIAIPLAWYGMQRWLEQFAYRTELSWWVFAGAALIGLAIAVLTVSAQTWRVARLNPARSLRAE